MSEFIRRTREDTERLEDETLAPAATKSVESRGRRLPELDDAYRTAFQRDRDRIIHSKAFRRLKHKTQVFINPEGDHYVTRLTHTLQVTQIGRSIARNLSLNEDLAEAICLAHDVGHSPFGHTGEDTLSEFVEDEWLHSEQGVRVFEVLEPANLSWEVLDGVRAHSWKIPEPPATPEGYICRFADRFAYLTHDVDDALRAGIIKRIDLPPAALARFGEPGSEWVASMIRAVVNESLLRGAVVMDKESLEVMNELRAFMFQNVYLRAGTDGQRRTVTGIVRDLVSYFVDHSDEIPDSYRHTEADTLTQVIDYVAGMTDRYAIRVHDDLYRPRLF
ncbi:MAG: deoxyguanosinetriphosphate triphosphohydrolase [Acidimicrobiia bacterium]|nr:deoxyguanosinetriphosphate triphosphohydrolase [Acidimicrobiia bacterium]MDX2467153.1 deoxyguanosinetriphosphate triphosphohydrolase [Acidimicrobiia bacterium]